MMPIRAPAERPLGNSVGLYGYAFLISFTGSLPVGTLNVSITNLVIDSRAGAAVLFGAGALLVEVGLVRIALVTIKRLEGMHLLRQWSRVIACVVILLLAYLSLEAAWHQRKAGAVIPLTGNAPFVSGLVLSLLNPLHLPFWMGWTAVLRSKGLLSDTRREYNGYVLAIGMGTGIAFLVYGITGHLLILFLRANQDLFNWLTGAALLITGLIQGWKTGVGWIRKSEKEGIPS
jgi:hypothetical protein